MLAQHMQALERANEIRLAGASWRRSLGELPRREAIGRLVDALEAEALPDYIGATTIEQAIAAIWRFGPGEARRLRVAARVRPRTMGLRLRDLTCGERRRLALQLRWHMLDRRERDWLRVRGLFLDELEVMER